jgi:Ca2+-binding RTX toxin-like protein
MATIYQGTEGGDTITSGGSFTGGVSTTIGSQQQVYGNGGNDCLIGIDSDQIFESFLYGGEGADTLVGGGRNDQASGGNGDDLFLIRTDTAGAGRLRG